MFINVRAAYSLVMILVVALALTGCQRQRAENSLKKTQQKLSEIEVNYGGNEHAPERVEEIQQKVDQARNLLGSDAGQALTIAKDASASADQLLEVVKPKQAEKLFAQAQDEIRVADINDLPRLEPERYNRIRELKTQADESKANNEWDEVIQFSNEIIGEVGTGLAGLKNEADRKGIDAEQALTNLTKIGGNIYAPEVVIAVRTDIDLARKISDEDRDYVLAANKFSEAKNRAEQGIIQVLREKSREAIEEIEGYLTEALIEGAKQFRNEDYQNANRLFEGVLVDYKEGRYNAVIEASKILLDRAQTLVIETKRAASDDRIQAMEANIQELEQGGILDYLPGSMDQLRQYLQESRTIRQRDTEEAFDEIKEISISAADEYERQRTAFQTVALDAIRNARNQLDTSRTVYDRMDTIFDPIEGEMTDDQRAFEAQKQSRQLELGQTLEQANSDLETAELRQQAGNFRGAIVLAREVEDTAEMVLSEVYHTVAHNAAIELAKLISRYERDGARQYAADELERSRQKLEQVKSLINQGQYKPAVETAAEARADVELMAQRIAGRATEDLREARRTLESASSENTRRYRSEMLDEVQALIEEAEQNLQEERLKIALETAQRATALALQAENEANMLAAKEQIDQAVNSITRAQESGAEVYAGREIEDARRLLSSSRTLYANEEYVKAAELASSSEQRAHNALYKKINEAETAITTAEAVDGWEYDHEKLAEANTKVREARNLIEQSKYSESADLADSAKVQASSLVKKSKKNNFNERVDRIRTNLEIGTIEGLNFFQPEESIEVRRTLATLQNEYSPDDYERVMTEVEQLEAKLRITLDDTDELVQAVSAQLDQRIVNLEESGAVNYAAVELANARKHLNYATLDYRKDAYKSAHSNLTKAIKLVVEVEGRQAETLYAGQVQELFDEYRILQDKFANVLTLSPAELKALAVGTDGSQRSLTIASTVSPNEFADGLDVIFSRALIIEVPRGLEKFHESVLNAFVEGRLAAKNFEKLVILDRTSKMQAFTLIDAAYFHMRQSNMLVTEIQSMLISDEVRFRLVGGETAAIVNAYD